MTENDPKQIFTAALDLAPEARIRFLDEACADNAELRGRVEDLLAAHGLAASFLEDPQAAFGLEEDTPGEAEGQKIGRYKLLQQIGEGGFGTVWMAEQQAPVRRMVALKIIKRGMDTRRVIARFEAERQALAMMDHPNIAKVLDGGETPGGRPYFVMELVRGVPITEFCDAQHLDARERLELFTLVCQAVHHAHQKGILHRDLKPSNILVTLHDGLPVPKVIDFGIAKATHQPLTEKTLFTEFRRMVGTPEYMAPEQAEMSGLDVDTRADIYSLGVLLYELLTGTKPLEMGEFLEKGYVEVLRVLKEDDPHKPSTRLSTLGGRSREVARRRRTDPGRLGRLLRGDVDWMVMKALEKDRARRYESAAAFAADVRRHLNNEPVLAGPPSRTYKLLKYVRRNRVGVTAAAAVLLALLVGAGAATWGFLDAREQAEIANAEATKANTVVELVEAALTSADPHELKDRNYTVRQLFGDFVRELGDRLEDQPEVDAAVRRLAGNAYVGLGLLEEAKPHLDKALGIRRRLGDDGLLVESLIDKASWFHDKGDRQGALELLEEAEGILGPDTDSDELVRVSRMQSDLHFHMWSLERAEERASFSLEMSRRLHPEASRQTASSLEQMGRVRWMQSELDEAVELQREALEMVQDVVGDEHPYVASSLVNLGLAVLWQHGPEAGEEAKALLGDALTMNQKFHEGDHGSIAASLGALGKAYLHQREHAEAEARFGEANEMLRRIHGDESHPRIAINLTNLGMSLFRQGRYVAAEEKLRESLKMKLELFGEDEVEVSTTQHSLAMVLEEAGSGQAEEAEDLLRQALRTRRGLLPGDHPMVANSNMQLGMLLLGQQRFAEAEKFVREAFEAMARRFGPDHELTRGAGHNLAHALDRLGKKLHSEKDYDSAIGRLKEAVDIERQVWEKDSHHEAHLLGTLQTLARSLQAKGDNEGAEPFYREVVDIRRDLPGDHELWVSSDLTDLGRVLRALGRLDEAEERFVEAMNIRRDRFGDDHPAVAASLHDLGEVLQSKGDNDGALSTHRDSLKIRSRRLRDDDHHTLDSFQHVLTLAYQLESEPILQEYLALARTKYGEHRLTAVALASLGKLLVEEGAYTRAEPLLDECLEIRKRVLPPEDGWYIYNAMSLLGRSIAGQGRHDEAEPLLVDGYKKMPDTAPLLRRREALEAVIRNYEDWGKPEEAARWQKKLVGLDSTGGSGR